MCGVVLETMNSLGVGEAGLRDESNSEEIASILAVAWRHLNGGDPSAALQAVSGMLEPGSGSV